MAENSSGSCNMTQPVIEPGQAEGQKSVTDRVKNFFGVGEIDEATKERYRQRREKCYRTDLKDQGDEVDFGRKRIGRRKCKGKKKESFVTIVAKAVAVEKSKHKQLNADEMMRSFAPGDLNKTESPEFTEFESELFYDEDDVAVPPAKPEESQMDMAMMRPRDDDDEDVEEVYPMKNS